MKIEITEKAKNELKRVLELREGNSKPLRIYVASVGWGGPSFGLALDEQKEDDIEVVVEDFTFIVEEVLKDNFGKFTIDYSDNWLRKGFTVIPDRTTSTC